ncbi:MAG: 2Fe-2S iron-sulfur cluster binding domain-containing protein [Actinophytocola sp.]|nr:2Fe-2S iron-sulfur cluster binding domain-containing protein [Actinophytocola sp.]
MPKKHKFSVNGKRVEVDADANMPLLWVLRDKLGVTGPKYGCGVGVCRTCTSHLDGEEIQPCVVPVGECKNKEVTTIEGLANGDDMHPVQQAWIDADVGQCGFCQPGQIMAAVSLLQRKAKPTDADIDAIENMCRCGTYPRLRAAIKEVAGMPMDPPGNGKPPQGPPEDTPPNDRGQGGSGQRPGGQQGKPADGTSTDGEQSGDKESGGLFDGIGSAFGG